MRTEAADGFHQSRDVAQQAGHARLAGKVASPYAGVLADEHDLPDAPGDEMGHLGEDIARGARVVAPADVGDGAEGAVAVAPVGDLDVGRRRLDGARDAGRGAAGGRHPEDPAEYPDDRVLLVDGDERGDLGHLLLDVGAVARRDAPGHDDRAPAARSRALLQDAEGRLDPLLDRRHQKRARVDHDDVRLVGVVDACERAARLDEGAHAVGIYLVLRTSERDEADVG